MLQNPLYWPNLTAADFILFPKVKKELAGLTLTKETLKKEREGAMRTLTTADNSHEDRGMPLVILSEWAVSSIF